MPSEPSVDQMAALNGLAGAFGWVLAGRSMPETANAHLDAESQAILDTRVASISSNLPKEATAAKRVLNAMARNGAPTVRAMVSIGKKGLVSIKGVTEAGMQGAVKIVEDMMPGLTVPTGQGDVAVLVRLCPSLGDVPWVALNACFVGGLEDTEYETPLSVEDILLRPYEDLDLGRFGFDGDRGYPALKANAIEFAQAFATAQHRLASGAR